MTIATIEHNEVSLAADIDYAKTIAPAAMLPTAYRGKPADIMLAVGLGRAMGLSPAESLYRIDVIQGKPTASAELIAANVRRAGHVLRLRVDEAATTATCIIIRSDDPDYEHTVTRDRAWAEQMGLLGKDNYKKQPATMLGWRAVTACARIACPEALYGVAYTADEMTDLGGREAQAGGGLGAALGTTTAQQVDPDPTETGEAMSDKTRREMFALFGERNIPDDRQLEGINQMLGTTHTSRGDLTEAQAREVIRVLRETVAVAADEDGES